MQRIILFIIASNIFNLSIAQDNQFIEVIVSDTLTMSPSSIEYNIWHIVKRPEGAMNQSNENTQLTGEEFSRILSKETMIANQEETFNYTLNSAQVPEFDKKTLVFQSKAELQKFISKLAGYNNVFGWISNTNISNKSMAEKILTKKLIDQATEKAGYTAELISKDVSSIIQITEIKSYANSANPQTFNLNNSIGWKAYPPLSNTHESNPINYILFKEIKVKFILKE